MADLFVNVLRAHQWIYENSKGVVGHRLLFGNPTLLLRTVGRKTGQERTNALTYGRDGKDYLVTASNGGSPRPPGWLANLKAKADCEIQVGTTKIPVTARATYPDDPEYARRFAIVDKVNGGRYSQYQEKTSRPIAVVVLSPR
ncbi:nitroreductase family deazaflavin-dependent oxidoreductase [Nocardia huaxiensis]|uniref:Nitroreductase family deazaflavin-dependent oxidoreductase n=1 Tax=Nocardia huaxiensis TaxID=2755382 RepID=A0A7D6VCS3_9NOCA|nr:nitroreductase family deazaflavin-dependent oxidoreductase [Nocardia huaxiensis]QLY33341.1 nitroreductase family deazaflavin-dependent oxidoreductase [Nocardia huaxiensis]UFS99750.1 nitroreductase family deazaflavin-dependent oxidoreductase [Nocardia huaxiensis]